MRAVDDFSASHVNQAFVAEETIDLADLDRIAVNVRAHMDALSAPTSLRPASSLFHGVERHAD